MKLQVAKPEVTQNIRLRSKNCDWLNYAAKDIFIKKRSHSIPGKIVCKYENLSSNVSLQSFRLLQNI